MAKSALQSFDGLDNRREIMAMLFRLGTDARRAAFLQSLIPLSLKGFKEAPMKVQGNCTAIAAYHMLIGVCNELGVDINVAAAKLEKVVRKL